MTSRMSEDDHPPYTPPSNETAIPLNGEIIDPLVARRVGRLSKEIIDWVEEERRNLGREGRPQWLKPEVVHTFVKELLTTPPNSETKDIIQLAKKARSINERKKFLGEALASQYENIYHAREQEGDQHFLGAVLGLLVKFHIPTIEMKILKEEGFSVTGFLEKPKPVRY